MSNLILCAALQISFLLSVVSLTGKNNTNAVNVMRETWDGHAENVELVYQDDHVAIYYDEDVNKNGNITWPFKIISQGWEYLKKTYGPFPSFSHDPLLYVILHASKYEKCRTSVYFEGDPQNRNQIDCGQEDEIETTPEGSDILKHLFFKILKFAFGENSPLHKIDTTFALKGMVRIFWYDLLKFLQDPTESLDYFPRGFLQLPENKIQWLRDWYFPIYQQFGETSVLVNYYNILRNNFNNLPSSPTDASLRMLNLGAFVHFWSGAARTDLLRTAIYSINNSREFYAELVEARKTFSFISYTRENCTADGNVVSCGSEVCAKNIVWRCNGKIECSDGTDEANCTDCKSEAFKCAKGGCVVKAYLCNYESDCQLDQSDESNCTDVWSPKLWLGTWKDQYDVFQRVYLDEDVVLYFGPDMNLSALWISQIYTEAWSHVKKTYGAFGRNPNLAVFLGAYDEDQAECVSYPSTESSFFYRNSMDCGKKGWALEDSSNFRHVLRTIVRIIRTETQKKNNPESIDIEVSRFEMNYIIEYDLHVQLKGVTDAEVSTWKEWRLNKTWNGVYFFRDWFLPIYEKYGGSIALGNFYRIVKSQWGKELKQESRKYLNVGEFVHFWSGAAGADLLPIALQIFNDPSFFYPLVKQAKENFPSINYTATQCREGQFKCEKDLVCIEKNWRCNRIQECNDNSDEANCNAETEASSVVPIVVGVLVLGLLIASIGVGWKISSDRRKILNLSQQIRNLTNEEVNDFLRGNITFNENDTNGSIHSRPFVSDYEIDPKQLVINAEEVLGSGEFGVVKVGTLQTNETVESTGQTVAVKMMKPNAKIDYFKAFLVEIKIMAFLGQHQNIASLLATVTSNIKNCEVFVALEFCSNGDLLRFVRKSCDYFQDMFRPKVQNVTSVVFTNGENKDNNSSVTILATNVPETLTDTANNESLSISTLDLLEWARQIADGMNYLTTKKVIHGDLAARNVLLTENKTAKISDFGLSRQLMNYSNYLKTSVSPLPWRWLAPESLSNMEFSAHSDVWAFGVTLWEIFTLGKIPYPEWSWNQEFMNDLANGMRLPSPQKGNDKINKVILNCMELVPAERIPFSEISLELQRIKQNLVSEANTPSTSPGEPTPTYTVLE